LPPSSADIAPTYQLRVTKNRLAAVVSVVMG
jgi:hypothetical protein